MTNVTFYALFRAMWICDFRCQGLEYADNACADHGKVGLACVGWGNVGMACVDNVDTACIGGTILIR